MSRKPPINKRHSYLMTREEARASGFDYYYTGERCHGSYGSHDNYRYTATGGCCECKRLDNKRQWSRKRQQTPERKAYQKKWHKDIQALGLGYCSMPGGGTGYRTLIPQGAIAKPDDAMTNEAARAKCKGKRVRDHICAVPQKRDHVQILIGLECAENLQVLTSSANQAKGNVLPHPSDFTRRAERQLTIDEIRWFVQQRMAVWAHDVTLGSKEQRATVRWELYRFGAGGLVEYLGEEPVLAEAAE